MKEISRKRLESKIAKFEKLGWSHHVYNVSRDKFNIVANKKDGNSYGLWDEKEVEEYKKKVGYIWGEVLEAKRYINLVKIHRIKYSKGLRNSYLN